MSRFCLPRPIWGFFRARWGPFVTGPIWTVENFREKPGFLEAIICHYMSLWRFFRRGHLKEKVLFSSGNRHFLGAKTGSNRRWG